MLQEDSRIVWFSFRSSECSLIRSPMEIGSTRAGATAPQSVSSTVTPTIFLIMMGMVSFLCPKRRRDAAQGCPGRVRLVRTMSLGFVPKMCPK